MPTAKKEIGDKLGDNNEPDEVTNAQDTQASDDENKSDDSDSEKAENVRKVARTENPRKRVAFEQKENVKKVPHKYNCK